MEHSMRAYLERQPTDMIELVLQACLKESEGDFNDAVILEVQEILTRRQKQQ